MATTAKQLMEWFRVTPVRRPQSLFKIRTLRKLSCIPVFTYWLTLGLGSAIAQAPADAETLVAIVKGTDPCLRLKQLTTYVDGLKAQDIPNAVRAVELSQGPGRALALSILVSKWADSDPKAAILEARNPGDRVTTETIISGVYASLTRRDLENAVLEVKQMPLAGVIINRAIDDMPSAETALSHTQQSLAEKRVTAMTAAVRTETELDPSKALQVSLEFRADYLWNDGLYIVFDRWPRRNLEEATHALKNLSPELRREGTRCVANSLVWKDPQSAVAWANQLPEGEMRSAAMQYVVQQWAQKDPAAAFKYARKLPLLREMDAILDQIINEWSLNDPRSAVEFIDGLPEGLKKTAMLETALDAWANGNFNAAMPRIQNIASIKERNKVLKQVLGSWAKVDPDSAVKWVQTLSPSERGPAWSGIIMSLAQSRPALAAEWFDKVPDYPRKNDTIQNLVYFWQQKDPEAAWNWVRKLPDSDLKKQLTSGVLETMAYVDFKVAKAHVDALPAGTFKDDCTETLVRSLVGRDAKAALKLLDTVTPSVSRDDFLSGLAYQLSQSDPKAAAIYGEAYPWQKPVPTDSNQSHEHSAPPRQGEITGEVLVPVPNLSPAARRADFLKDVVGEWFDRDPTGAAAWLKSLPDDEVKQRVLEYSYSTWASADFDAAAAYALTLPPGPLHIQFIDVIVGVIADNDPAKALEWIKRLKNPSEAARIKGDLLWGLAQKDPETAIQYLSALSDEKLRSEVIDFIAHSWPTKDPLAAARWAAGLPENKQKEDAFSLIASEWFDQDPEHAKAWLDQLPSGLSRDAALSGYSNRIYAKDHTKIALAYEWSEKIADPNRKQTMETYLLQEWMGIDPAAAEPLIEKSSLPVDTKKMLLQAQAHH